MRALSASVILSSIALGSCLTSVNAQDADIEALPGISPAPYGTTLGDDNPPPGVIPQPSLEFPGVTTGIKLGELYTDNLTLTGRSDMKQSSWVTQIQPFIRAAYSGPRLSGQLSYTLTGYLYQGESRRNQVAQSLDSSGTLTILPQHFFLNGSALYGREVINSELPSGAGTFFLDNNRANVSRFTLSPYWIQDLGSVGTMSARYSYGRVMYDTKGISAQNSGLLTGIPDITSNAIQFSIASPRYEKWNWHFDYSNQYIKPDFRRGSRFALAKLGAGFEVSDSTRLLADVGKENKFLTDGTIRTMGATFWDVGVERSSERNNVKLLVGHRFYGRSYQFSWTRTAALLTTAVNYVERPTDLNQQLLGQGADVIPIIGLSPIPSLGEQRVYLMKRGTASVSYQMPKSTVRLAVYDERRTYLALNGGQERVLGANVAWSFRVGAYTTLTPTYGRQHYQHQDGQIRNNQYIDLALAHRFSPSTFGTVRVRRDSSNVQSAVPGAYGYRANVIFLQLTHLF